MEIKKNPFILEIKKNPFILACIGLVATGCGGYQIAKPDVNTFLVSPHTLENNYNLWRLTRISEEIFVATDTRVGGNGKSASYALDYMRSHGCTISNFSDISGGSMKIEVNNSKDCLPELK